VVGTVAGDWDDNWEDSWTNGRLMRGIRLGQWEGATWPRHGFPCGTRSLDKFLGKILDSMRFNRVTSIWENVLVGTG
jgi:hypothetical protein